MNTEEMMLAHTAKVCNMVYQTYDTNGNATETAFKATESVERISKDVRADIRYLFQVIDDMDGPMLNQSVRERLRQIEDKYL